MRLTICLVTKGRENYLTSVLASFEKFLSTSEVEVLLIDNGCDITSKRILDEWRFKFPSQVFYSRLEVNSSAPIHFWEILKEFAPDWVLLPGDDDKLVFEIYDEWRKELEFNPELNAFASSAQIIDSSGKLLKQIRKPPLIGLFEGIESLAHSLHEAPFFWPGLFFKFGQIPEKIVNSRYVFDWWVSLHLVLSGNFKVTESIGVQYRVHSNQESFQSSNRRKFFEGFNMLTSFIKSNEFECWIRKLSDSDKIKLISSIEKIRPIYSQEYFYLPIVKEISNVIIKNSSSEFLRLEIAEKYLLSGGVFTKRNDLSNLFNGLLDSPQSSPGNFALACIPGTCEKLMQTEIVFNKVSDAIIEIYCRHSKPAKGAIFVDCKKINELSNVEISDKIILLINQEYEFRGDFNFTVTPKERYLITLTRAIRPNLPGFIKGLFNRLKR